MVWSGNSDWDSGICLCWLQGTGIKTTSLDTGCRRFPRPAEWSRSKVCAMLWEVWSPRVRCVYVSLGGGLESWCALAAPSTTLPEAAAAGRCKQIASPCCCTALQMLAATSWAQTCSDPSKWSLCPGHMHVFPLSLCGRNCVPGSRAGCPCVTRPEMFSYQQSVTFILALFLASFLELQNLILHVLLRRLALPLWRVVLIYSYACGKAVKTYTSLKHWTWSYHLVGKHCRQAKRRFSRELSTHQQFLLPTAVAVCWLLLKHNCHVNCTSTDQHWVHAAGM